MEIYGKVINEKGDPVSGASIQRYYPDGQAYSSVIPSSIDGSFNGRVPDRNYFWVISAPGYLSLPVSLENALHDRADLPIVVQLEADPSLALSVSPPPIQQEEEQISPVWYFAGGVAIAGGALWYLSDNRTKVKIRKIFQ
jgi:hypothetical protein